MKALNTLSLSHVKANSKLITIKIMIEFIIEELVLWPENQL